MIARSQEKRRKYSNDHSRHMHARVLRENVQKDIANIVHGMHSRTLYLAIVD